MHAPRLALRLSLLLAVACGPRMVEVRTAADLPPEAAVAIENTLAQAVNVYVVAGGTELFLRQVGPGQSIRLPVRGIPAGSLVTLRATTRDGGDTYRREDVRLQGTYSWRVP